MKGQMRARRAFEVLEVRNLLSITPVVSQAYTPDDIRTAYGIDNITFGPAGSTIQGDGSGQTIAIIEDDGDDKYLVNSTDKTATTLYPITYAQSDMALFNNQFGEEFVGNFFTVVGAGGGARPSWKSESAGTFDAKEYAMDVEWAHAMAPLAHITLIEAVGDLETAITTGVAATGADVVMLSQNDSEFSGGDQIVPGLPVSDFNQPGVTFISASGDNGTPVTGPGDYPNVIDVAASDLTLNNDQFSIGTAPNTFTITSASYNSEVGWSNPPPGKSEDNVGGSGGGYTLFPSSLAPYQNGLTISDGNQTVSNNGERVTPDLSFVGGDSTTSGPKAAEIYSHGHLTTSGGTSLSAACFAGLVAIADEGAEYSGYNSLTKSNFGGYGSLSTAQTLEALYNLPSYDFHDITSGFNGYSAGKSYDLVSGLGTPVANQLVPDLARAAANIETSSGAAGNVVYAPLSYEAPEVYASVAAKTAIANNMTLVLNGTMIDIYDNSTGTAGLGTLVAADPLASTSQININGGDYAANTLTINFNNGNMIPAGGLYFDGVSYEIGTYEKEGFTPTNGGPVGIPSLTMVGQLPNNAPGASSKGIWTSETVRPLSPTAGLITLGGVYNINYSDFASPAKATTPAIFDETPANDVSYIALGSNIDTITILQGPKINGIQSTQYESTGPQNPGPLFTPVNFINKTGVTVADADGNDTVFVNFNNGNPLPASGLTFNGGTGLNTINITGNHNFTLSSAGVTDTTLGGGSLNILNEQNFVLTGGAGNNQFTITTWTGTGTIVGGGGQDTVEVKKTVNMGVNGSYVGASDGMLINTSGIAATVLQGMGSGTYSFTVNSWAANSGALWLNGGTGSNIYYVGTPQTEDLDTIKQIVDINAFGSANSLVLYDQKNNSFVNYTLASTSVTSKLQTIQGGGSRPFKGVTIKSGVLTSETINANKDGSTFFLTPAASTTYTVNGAASAPTQNYLDVNFSGAQSPTLFNTNGSGTSGLFMFANDAGLQFSNIAVTDYTGSVGAVNAVAATAGSASLPTVQIVNSVTGQTLQTLTNVYPAGYSGGVQVAIGNVIAGSGIPDVIIAPGVGEAPYVKIYSVLTGALIESFLAQSSSYNYGLDVAVGDVNGDGRQDIITAPMVGAASVSVFLNNGSTTAPFTAYSASTPKFTAFSNISGYQGGVDGLAVGNVTNNPATSGNSAGAGDIIVGSGVGTKAIAQVFNYYANGVSSTPALTITPTFSASVTGGVSVAVADVNGDGVPDVVLGAGANGTGLIDVWSGKTKTIISQFTAFTGAGNNAAVHVAIAKISSGVNDILASQGINGQSHDLKVFKSTGAAVDTVMETSSYLEDGINVG
ncbi:MAG TPA: hypothetical protein VHY91_23560 [Pirellulales bacterium]|jgi:hypothetical protein|nr:hypothetical protein [Pirellulales bacterium]